MTALDDALAALTPTAYRYSVHDLALADGAGVRFDGTGDVLRADALAALFSGSYMEQTVFLVAAPSSSTGDRSIVAAGLSSGTNPLSLYGLSAGTMTIQRRGTAGGTILRVDGSPAEALNAARLLSYRYRRREAGVWSNGVGRAVDSPLIATTATTADRLSFGALTRTTESGFFAGDIAEIILTGGAIADADMDAIEALIAAEYGLTVTARPDQSATRNLDCAGATANVPSAAVIDGKVYVGGVRADGMIVVGELGGAGDRVSIEKYTPDDHNPPGILHKPGKAPVIFYNNHAGATGLRWRKSETVDALTPLSGVTAVNATGGHPVHYALAFSETGDNITVFGRAGPEPAAVASSGTRRTGRHRSARPWCCSTSAARTSAT